MNKKLVEKRKITLFFVCVMLITSYFHQGISFLVTLISLISILIFSMIIFVIESYFFDDKRNSIVPTGSDKDDSNAIYFVLIIFSILENIVAFIFSTDYVPSELKINSVELYFIVFPTFLTVFIFSFTYFWEWKQYKFLSISKIKRIKHSKFEEFT